MTTASLSPSEYHPNYAGYIAQIPESQTLVEALAQGLEDATAFYTSLPAKTWDYRYEETKWTPRELLQHIIDAERVFNFRAMCFARKDKTAIPGFDQDLYIDPEKVALRTSQSLIDEFVAIRKCTIIFFSNLDEEQLKSQGKASGFVMSARAAGFLNAGHELHHRKVIAERYL